MWWNLDSGFQRRALSCMPDSKAQDFGLGKFSRVLDFAGKNFPDSEIPIPLQEATTENDTIYLSTALSPD